MPIEIKELVIRAVVTNEKNLQQNTAISPADILKLKREITKEVTEKVLKALKQKNER